MQPVQARGRLNVKLNGKLLEKVKSFKYVGSTVARDARMDVKVCNRVKETTKCLGGMKSVMKKLSPGNG